MQVADWILETTNIIKIHVFADFGDTSSAQKKINKLFSESKKVIGRLRGKHTSQE